MPDYRPSWHHQVIARAIHDMVHADSRRLIISVPPRHGKSELVSRRLPAWILGNLPDTSIIATSYSADLASRLNRDVQRIIDSEAYQKLFPDTRLNDSNSRTVAGSYLRNSDVFEVVGHKGCYRSSGVGGGITGMGAHWLIIDDPIKNREEADSPTIRQNIWDWYTSTLYTRQQQDARILVVMTRWHAEDLAGKLITLARDDTRADQWQVIELPAIAEHHRPAYDPRSEGEALWEDLFPIRKLEQMRASIGDYEWAALYQQRPRAGGGVEWPESYFAEDIWFDEWPASIQTRVIGVDPSKGSSSRHGDYSAIVRLGRATDGKLFVEADLARRSSEAIVDSTLEAQGDFRADAIAFESNQFQELLAVQLQKKAIEAGFPVPVVQVHNTINKAVRIRRLGPYLGQKLFRFKAASPGTKLLVEQLRDFPVAAHDDGPDSLEMALRVMIDMWNGRKTQAFRRIIT